MIWAATLPRETVTASSFFASDFAQRLCQLAFAP